MSTSLIYRHIYLYRLIIKILYKGKYEKRFQEVYELIPENTKDVTELCFGDILLADKCQKSGIKWKGYDLSSQFVELAKAKGFEAECMDILKIDELPKSDVYVIQGSLYHFAKGAVSLIEKIMDSTQFLIISEPVKNLTDMPWPFSFLANMTTKAKGKIEDFRYSAKTFTDLRKNLESLGYLVQSFDRGRDHLMTIKKSSDEK